MRNEGRMTALVSIASVLLMMSTSFAAFTSFGDGPRNPGLDVEVTNIKTHKDIDDPFNGGDNPYPPETCTTVTATVKNTGTDPTSSGFAVQMNVGRGTPVKAFYADAESGALPAGWSVTDFTQGRWHITTKTADSASHSAWCGPDGDAGVQYGVDWEEVMDTTNSITVPSTNPVLTFNTLYVTKFATDGGYVEIQDTSLGGDVWDQSGPTTWQFEQGNYNTTTAAINPVPSNDTKCFGGDSNGWNNIMIDLSNYAGKDIKIRFLFSSSSTVSGALSGWFIDDVVVTDGTTAQFSDDFEGGMGQWTATNLLGATPTAWGVLPYPNQPYNASSTKCFSNTESVVNNSYYDGEDSALVTSTIPLTGYTNARLHLWTKIVSQTASDGGFIEVQKAAGEWMYLKPFMKNYCSTLDPDSPYGSAGAYSDDIHMGWTYETFDLSAFAGNNIKIRFHFYANNDGQVYKGWFIDEVTIIAWNFQPSDSKQVNVVSQLNPGESVEVNFLNVDTTLDNYYYLLTITCLMPGDTNPLNDMSYVIIEVRKVINQTLSVLPSLAPVAHGRKTTFQVNVQNIGNMRNDVNLQNSTLPPYWNVTFDHKNPVSINAGSSVAVNMSVTNPVNTSSTDYSFSVFANSTTDPTKSASQKVTITVYNNPPTAAMKPNVKGRVYNPMPFDGSLSSDPEQDPLNYTWDFGDGTGGFGEWINHSFTAAGIYNVTLTVSDGGPLSSDSTWQSVNISDDAPVAVIDIDTVANNGTYQRDTSVTFNGTRSRDEAPGLLNYTWDFGDNSDYAYDPIVPHNYTTGGFFNVTLTVTDPGGQTGAAIEPVRINNPPVAHISSPLPNAIYYTTDEIAFNSNGSYDPDSDPLTFQWTTNQLPGEVLSNSAGFSKALNITGYHIITLTVYDGKGVTSYGIDQITIWVQEKINQPPKLENGSVDPQTGDEGVTAFRYTVTYSDPNDDVPDYMQVIIDGDYKDIQSMFPVDPLDNNYTDGKDFYFSTTALKGETSPHNYTFITADRHGSGVVQTDVYNGPTVNWVRTIGKDSYTNIIQGKVYQTGPYRTLINALNNLTPPDIPTGTLSLGVVFAMNTTAPPDRWYWANITLAYSSFNYSKINESTLRLYWSVDGGPWTVVPDSGLDLESQILWMNVTRSTAKFAVFGSPAPVGPIHHRHNPTAANNSMLYLGVGAAVVAILVVVVAAVYLRRRPVVPPEPDYQGVEEAPLEQRKERKWAKTEDAARPDAMVGTTGEEVKVFRPAGGEVKVFRPGGEEKIFKPAETEEEEKIFRPGAKEEVEEEARESPMVEEEASREKVVEYTEGGEEEAPSMPGARPAEQEVERSEETESAPAPRGTEAAPEPPRPATGPGEERPADKARPAEKKTEDESLDELLDDLNK